MLATALRELQIEAYVSGMPFESRFKLANIVLMSPGMDADVAIGSCSASVRPRPAVREGRIPGRLPSFPVRLTVYTSDTDKALTMAEF